MNNTPARTMGAAAAPAPSAPLGAVMTIARAYSKVFSESRLAPLLSKPRPIRHTGFEMTLRIERRVEEADGVVSLALSAPDGRPLPGWAPGAHLDVFLPSGVQRQYSLCGNPDERHRYRIAVRRIPDGSGSVEAHDGVEEGTRITVRGPRNAFPFAPAEHTLYVAAGIGITPILPMVRAASSAGQSWRLVYLGRSRATMPFLEELAALPGGTVEVLPDDEAGLTPIEDILASAPQAGAIYLCGPAPLIDAAHRAAPRIRPGCSLHTERFTPPPVAGGEPFTIRLARTAATVTVAADETALTAIRRAAPAARYSCRQGFCGTCKVRVLSGEVDHRDHRLLEAERADAMLPCVSRSAGGPLEIDL
ncbi:MAG: PDR/VanB family oxidoreductase [Tomitella sp.]|nr:PDR/VanB family oxidoreductase [Tomitella sp.]